MNKYDPMREGFVDQKNVENFLDEIFVKVGLLMKPERREVMEYMREVDSEDTGKISKRELEDFVKDRLRKQGMLH
jgi:hypothetical protein